MPPKKTKSKYPRDENDSHSEETSINSNYSDEEDDSATSEYQPSKKHKLSKSQSISDYDDEDDEIEETQSQKLEIPETQSEDPDAEDIYNNKTNIPPFLNITNKVSPLDDPYSMITSSSESDSDSEEDVEPSRFDENLGFDKIDENREFSFRQLIQVKSQDLFITADQIRTAKIKSVFNKITGKEEDEVVFRGNIQIKNNT